MRGFIGQNENFMTFFSNLPIYLAKVRKSTLETSEIKVRGTVLGILG